MTRVSLSQLSRGAVNDVFNNYKDVVKYSDQISSGYKVTKPGDSQRGSTISELHNALNKISSYSDRLKPAKAFLSYQEEIVSQASDIVLRGKELASQAASETYSAEQRATIAKEVWQLRNQLVSLANSKYQGRYVWGGTDSDDPPYDAATYTNSGSTDSSQRYVYDSDGGSTSTNSAMVADGISVTLNTPGSEIYSNGIQALERLGRALEGYDTTLVSGVPSGAGAAYTFPADYHNQTLAIQSVIETLNTAREVDMVSERTDLAARISRLESAESLLEASKMNADEVLNEIQNADAVSAAANLQQAQYALQAAMAVSSRVLNLSILDYL